MTWAVVTVAVAVALTVDRHVHRWPFPWGAWLVAGVVAIIDALR